MFPGGVLGGVELETGFPRESWVVYRLVWCGTESLGISEDRHGDGLNLDKPELFLP